jgi:hypothetical protein
MKKYIGYHHLSHFILANNYFAQQSNPNLTDEEILKLYEGLTRSRCHQTVWTLLA